MWCYPQCLPITVPLAPVLSGSSYSRGESAELLWSALLCHSLLGNSVSHLDVSLSCESIRLLVHNEQFPDVINVRLGAEVF